MKRFISLLLSPNHNTVIIVPDWIAICYDEGKKRK
ncbi:hypothetical protein BBR47_22210 [Brevibacillus brevis NBRC 100599]|uniref:Uncharacterized protein n=1 Tax=Brevibacillus brevis (strain 47 / JCM 6285 / NBRC 100599) TaxID=358681 RepID=C0ZBN9_BREBN|nr:hypothetical protein BBR47_22210 [Brevibacillus brevis NBRC 100599]